MNRGPRPGAIRETDFVARARETWGEPPEWVLAIAAEANRTNATETGKRLGYSSSVVSTVISNSYRGNLGRVEEIVRGALMAETVMCPVLGEIGRDQCRREQATPFRATNSSRARLKRACKTCSNNATGGQDV